MALFIIWNMFKEILKLFKKSFQWKRESTLKTTTLQLQHCNYNIATTTLQHYNTTSLQHYNTTTLQHYNTTTLQCYNATTLQHYNTTTLQHYNATMLKRYNTTTTTLSINDAQHTFIIHTMLTFLTLMLNAEYCVYARCPFATTPWVTTNKARHSAQW
jgi:hypothetical protein